MKKAFLPTRLIFLIILILTACSSNVTAPTPTPTSTATAIPVTATPIPTSTPLPTETLIPTPMLDVGSTWTRPADGMVMSYIPAGEFSMGSADGNADEQPVHTVYLDAFWMGQTELTNSMYVKCIDAGACDDPAGGKHSTAQGAPNNPTIATWDMANSYCKWAGGRLPTEAEWEKAARGGLEGKKYPWGDESPTCQEGAKNGAKTHNCLNQQVEVKTFAPNGYGLYDMAGNLWEWVNDWYASGYYGVSPSSNPTGPNSGESHVLRGGSWCENGSGLFTSLREGSWGRGCSSVESVRGNGVQKAHRASAVPFNSLLGFRCSYNVNP